MAGGVIHFFCGIRSGRAHACCIAAAGAFMCAARASQQADFFIIENPSALTIFSRFEQPLAASRRASLPQYAAFQIVKDKTMLGDEVTAAIRVRMDFAEYFILCDEDAAMLGAGKAGSIQRMRNCAVLGDTVTVARDGAAVLSNPRKRIRLAKGQKVIRVFNSGGRSYCLAAGGAAEYGWCDGDMSALTAAPAPVARREGPISDDIARRIARRIESANSTYEKYFAYFNKETGNDKTVPRWDIEQTADMMRCTLKAAADCRLDESTGYIVRDIEHIVSEQGLAVSRSANTITIAPQ